MFLKQTGNFAKFKANIFHHIEGLVGYARLIFRNSINYPQIEIYPRQSFPNVENLTAKL